MVTRTRTEVARLEVGRRGDRTVIVTALDRSPIGLRALRDPGCAVGIVQTAACLVAGDDVGLEVTVGPGATLILRDISATLAHPGGLARQRITLRLGPGARCWFDEQPFIVAAGARVQRDVHIELAGDAVLLHTDTLVLGRHGEQPGAARLGLRVERDGRPVLVETLDTADRATLRSAAVLGESRTIGTVGLFGADPGDLPAEAFRLGPSDTLVRWLGGVRELDDLATRWSGLLDLRR